MSDRPRPRPGPGRRATVLALGELASELAAQPGCPIPGTALRRVERDVLAAVEAAEQASATAHEDGLPREADVARRLGVDPATLRRWRRAQERAT